MDPNTCFSEILKALAEDDWDLATDFATDLKDWLAKGGFAPGGGTLEANTVRNFCIWVMRQGGV